MVQKIEVIGGVNKGTAYFQIPGHATLPDLLKKHHYEFRARNVIWKEVTDVQNRSLIEAAVKIASTLQNYKEWKDYFEKDGGEGKWHYLIVQGKYMKKRKGAKNWVINWLVPPWFSFDELGKFPVAVLKDGRDAHTWVITGIPTSQWAFKSFHTFEEFLSSKKVLLPESRRNEENPWSKDQRDVFKKEWKEKHASKPWRAYGIWMPWNLTPKQMNIIDGLKIAVTATVMEAENNAVKAARADSQEQTIKVQRMMLTEAENHMMDQNRKIASLTQDKQDLETVLDGTTVTPMMPPQQIPPTLVLQSLLSVPPKTKAPMQPGSFKSLFWILFLFVGIAAFGFGQWAVGAGMFALSFGTYYFDYQYERRRKEKMKGPEAKSETQTAGESMVEAGRTLSGAQV